MTFLWVRCSSWYPKLRFLKLSPFVVVLLSCYACDMTSLHQHPPCQSTNLTYLEKDHYHYKTAEEAMLDQLCRAVNAPIVSLSNAQWMAAMCVHLCLYALCIDACMHLLSFSSIPYPTLATVALLSPLFCHHTCFHSHYGSLTCLNQPPPLLCLMLWSGLSSWVFSYPVYNIMLISGWNTAVFWDLMGAVQGSLLPLILSKSRWLQLGWAVWMSTFCFWM